MPTTWFSLIFPNPMTTQLHNGTTAMLLWPRNKVTGSCGSRTPLSWFLLTIFLSWLFVAMSRSLPSKGRGKHRTVHSSKGRHTVTPIPSARCCRHPSGLLSAEESPQGFGVNFIAKFWNKLRETRTLRLQLWTNESLQDARWRLWILKLIQVNAKKKGKPSCYHQHSWTCFTQRNSKWIK